MREFSFVCFHKKTLAAVTATTCLVGALLLLQGCGGGEPEFDKTALHTPETLVQEFVIRYKALPAQASAKEKARAARIEKAKAAIPDVDAESNKSSRLEAESKKKNAEKLETLDHLIETLELRLGRLKDISRADAAKKVIELIEKEPSIKKDDRQAVIDRLGKVS